MGVCGNIGEGKTLFTTRYVIKSILECVNCRGNDPKSGIFPLCECGTFKRRYNEFLANYHIKSPSPDVEVKLLKYDGLIHLGKLDSALVVLDEVYVWFDSRTSGTKRNRAISYVVLQSRKKGMDIVYTAQAFSSVDLRLRKFTHVRVLAERLQNGDFQYTQIYGTRIKVETLPLHSAVKIFGYFDTNEIVDFEAVL